MGVRGKSAVCVGIWLALACSGIPALARQGQGTTPPPQPGTESPDTDTGQAATTAATTEVPGFWSSVLITPQVSIVYPIKLTLVDSNFRVPFSQEFAGIPLFSVGLAKSLATRGDFQFYGQAQLGFASKTGLVNYTQLSNGAQGYDRMQVTWLPVSVALKTIYRIPGVDFVKPFLSVGGGMQWLHESAIHISALRNDFLVPFYVIAPGFAFLEGRNTDWFGGFNFSVSYSGSLDSNQSVQGLGFDLSLNILL